MTKKAESEKQISDFRPGDRVKIDYKIYEGGKVRVQPFEGIVIAKKGSGNSKTLTVRRVKVGNPGVERIFSLNSPNIKGIKVTKKTRARRAKLYYIRGKKGKAAMEV